MNYERGDVITELIARKLGHLPKTVMDDIDKILQKSLGLK